MAAILALGLALWGWGAGPAHAYHHLGCPTNPGVNFGGGDPAAHNWMNICTPAANVYFFGTFGNLAGGDPSGMCGYLIVDGSPPADVYVGIQGNMQGGLPNPMPQAGFGDYPADHDGLGCGIPDS